MESRDKEAPGSEADITAAVPLEIDEATAARAEDLLREFAEDAGLETVLVVDRSGALVAGISSEADVTVEIISALVAGASGAMRALVARLGETGALESLHFGGNRFVYLKETVHRFILVAVAEAARPAGLVRQKAFTIDEALVEVLGEVHPASSPASPPVAAREDDAASRWEGDSAALADEFPFDPEPELEEAFAALDLRRSLEEDGTAETGEPRGIHEPIDFGDPEIVIEPSSPPSTLDLPIDSPFEEEEVEMDRSEGTRSAEEGEEEEEEEPSSAESRDAVFEPWDDEEEDDLSVVLSPPLPAVGGGTLVEDGVELVGQDEAPLFEPVFEAFLEEAPVVEEAPEGLAIFSDDDRDEEGKVFEFDDEAGGDEREEGDAEGNAADEAEDSEAIGRELEETIAEEDGDEESEIRGSGPFYF